MFQHPTLVERLLTQPTQQPTQGLDEIIASKIESLLPTLLARTGGRFLFPSFHVEFHGHSFKC